MADTITDSHVLLASRFNAHLTFNVLSAIQSCLLLKNYDQADELVTAYSRILRRMLINGNITTTLAEELAAIRDYLQIEMIRSDNHLDYRLDISALPGNLRLPKSLLAGFIENAVKHGLRNTGTNPRIRLRGQKGPGPLNTILISNLAPDSPAGAETANPSHQGLPLIRALILEYQMQTGATVDFEIREHPVGNGVKEVMVVVRIG